MCGFAATLAEDLFTEARLMGAAIDTGAAIAIRRVRDLEFFLDQLAMLEWKTEDPGSATQPKVGLKETGPDAATLSGPPRPPQYRHLCPEAVRAWPPTSMDRKRPQLSIDELRQLRWLLGGLLVLISVATVGYMEMTPGCSRPSRPSRCCWRWPGRICRRACHPRASLCFSGHRGAVRVGFLLQRAAVAGNVHLDYLLLLYRGVSYRKKRDDLQIIVLGLFLVMVAGVLTVRWSSRCTSWFSLPGRWPSCLSSR